jgi:integrase
MLNAWGEWLMAESGPKLTLDTAKKQWRCVRAILRRVGPREAGNPRALGFLDRVPAMDPLEELALGDDRDGPQDVTDEQIGRIYAACDVADWPGDASVLQWRTYLVILSVMGPRVNDAATLTRENFSFDPASPVARSVRTYEHGWLVYRPTKTARKKSAKLIVPLPPVVSAHVRALAARRGSGQAGSGLAGGGGRLFGWPDARGHRFAATWQRIVDHAGLPHIERRHMRATANLRWDRAGGDRQLGRWVLGHAARDVNDQHYMRAEPDLIAAAPQVEVPAPFAASPGDAPTQLFLFG